MIKRELLLCVSPAVPTKTMADLKKVIQASVPLADRISETESARSILAKKKERIKAEKVYDDRLDDIVVETYDKQYNYNGDVHDFKTNVKMSGFYD